MRQESFEQAGAERWQAFAEMLDALEAGEPGDDGFPAAYRRVCQDLALATDRRFGAALVDRLNELALRGHHALYGTRRDRGSPASFLARTFPRAVRREARLFAAASLLFYGAIAGLFALERNDPDLVYALMSPEQIQELEGMYDPESRHYGVPRGSETDVQMFAYYISNNVGIAFRTFAGGVFFGLGSLFILLFNGVFLGLVTGHIVEVGYGETFFPFVIGHGSFELTAIVLAGVAGARLGLALLAPGRHSRLHALRAAAHGVVPILYGLTAMLVVAAVLEAFWSSSRLVPAEVKLAVGAMLWLLVAAWLALGGRGGGD